MDKYDIPNLFNNIWQKMPRQTDSTIKVKKTFGQMPKNLMDYSDCVNDKFLNNHLAEIEESTHKGLVNDKFLSWFGKNQTYRQNDTHDNFLTKLKNYIDMDMKSPVLACGFLISPFRFAVIVVEVETDGTGNGDANTAADFLEAGKCTTFTSGTKYDQMKLDIDAAAGNLRVALYDDNAGEPLNLLSESVSVTPVVGYTTDYAITEVEVTATTAWMAHNQDSASLTWSFHTADGVRAFVDGTQTFGAMPDPIGTLGTPQTATIPKMKTSHT